MGGAGVHCVWPCRVDQSEAEALGEALHVDAPLLTRGGALAEAHRPSAKVEGSAHGPLGFLPCDSGLCEDAARHMPRAQRGVVLEAGPLEQSLCHTRCARSPVRREKVHGVGIVHRVWP